MFRSRYGTGIDLERLLKQLALLPFGLNGEGIHGPIDDVGFGDNGKHMTCWHHEHSLDHQMLVFSDDQTDWPIFGDVKQSSSSDLIRILKGVDGCWITFRKSNRSYFVKSMNL